MPSREQLDKISANIAVKTKEYLDAGHTINVIPVGKTGGPYGDNDIYEQIPEEQGNDLKVDLAPKAHHPLKSKLYDLLVPYRRTKRE